MNKSTLETYYQEYMKEWEAEAAAQQTTVPAFFLKYSCDVLDSMGYDLADFQPGYHIVSTHAGNEYTVIDGYCYDESENMLTLVLCDFCYNDTLTRLTKTDYETQVKRIEKFYQDAKTGKYHNIDPSREVYPLIQLIEKGVNNTPSFDERKGVINLHIITNKRSQLTPHEEKILPSGCKLIYRISDFETISEAKPQPLVIDFTQYENKDYQSGLPFLPAPSTADSDFYQAYLLVLPADVLVKCYDTFRARLLEQNVRVYLQKRGKVNQGIHDTIKKEPYVFFIYNNGLAITAEKVILSADRSRIEQIHGLQVVNGGQTMASLHHAWKEGLNVSAISLQAKLTVVSPKITRVIVPYISRYSNSQNAIKDTDQHSNDIVQIQLEKHASKIKTPGSVPTTWFYERMRGQYANAQLHLSQTEIKAFQRKNPKAQLVQPTAFAQAVMTFEMMPFLVVRGAQKAYNGTGNIKGFCSYVSLLFTINPGYILSEVWYKENMGKFILVKEAKIIVKEVILKHKPQFKSFAASITTYTISSLVYILAEASMSINCLRIWEKQGIDSSLTKNLQLVARNILKIVSKRPDHSEWLKKSSTWDDIKQTISEAQLTINSEGPFYITRKPTLITELAKTRDDYDDLTPEQKRVMIACPDMYWSSLTEWIENSAATISPANDKVLKKRILNHKLTDKQCRDLWSFAQEAKGKGWHEPYTPELRVENEKFKLHSIQVNPIQEFLNGNKYDILVLERSCDLKGGSNYLDELFKFRRDVQENEALLAAQGEVELGATLSFSVGPFKKVVFAYTKKTQASASYLPIVEVCLQTVAHEFDQKKILTTFIGCESNSPEDRLQQQGIKNIIEKTLYNQDVTISVQ